MKNFVLIKRRYLKNHIAFRLVLVLCLLIPVQLSAQQRLKQTALHLQNGSELRGKLVESGERYVLQTADGSTWVYGKEEVVSVDTVLNSQLIKESGFLHITEIAMLSGKRSEDFGMPMPIALGLRSFNGYQFHPKFAMGLTTGLEGYDQIVVIPLALGFRGDIHSGRISPFYAVDIGSGADWAHRRQSFEQEITVGFGWSAAVGLKLRLPQQSGLTLSVGYQQQRADRELQQWWGGQSARQEYTFKRLALRMGFCF